MLTRSAHRRLKGFLCAIRLHPVDDRALRQLVERMKDVLSGDRTTQRSLQLIQPALSIFPGRLPLLLGLAGADMGVGDEKEPVLGVVEGHQRIVEMQLGIGQLCLPLMRVGDFLDIPNRIVAQVAHGAAGQRRQAGHGHGHIGLDRLLQDLEEVTREVFFLTIPSLQGGRLADRREGQEGISTQEGIAPDSLPSLNALKEKGGSIIPAKAQKGDNRSQGVSRQLPVYRDQRSLVGVALEIGIVHRTLQRRLNKKKPSHRAHNRWEG